MQIATHLVIIGVYMVPAVLLIVVIAGFRFVTSMGNPEKIEGAKKMLIASVTGLIIVLFAYTLITFVLNTIGATDKSGAFVPIKGQEDLPADNWYTAP